MSYYERLREEVQDAKRSKKSHKARAQPPARFSWEERAKIQKGRLWRYYRAAAIARRDARTKIQREVG